MPLAAKFIHVKSSLIDSVAWLASTRRIAIKFKASERVRFYSATPAIWQALMSAESIGRFYNRNLKQHRAADSSRESTRSQRPGASAVSNQSQDSTVRGAA